MKSQRSFTYNLFYSIRPSACTGVALFAVAGLGRWDDLFITTMAFACGFIGGAGCFLINDIFDREKDIQNKKNRPIATGALKVHTALLISIGCCLFMLGGAYFLNIYTFMAAALLIAAFWSYSYINQHFGLLANIWVAICSSLAFLCGAMVYGLSEWVLLAMIITIFVNSAREILLDVLDQVGDRAVGKPTVPLQLGTKKTIQLIIFLYVLGSSTAILFVWQYPHAWAWIISLLLCLWTPFFLKQKADFRGWALFNVRASHVFFLFLIVLLFLRP